MKKVISIFLLLFFLVAMVPSPGFCEDKDKDNATSGAANAGKDAGQDTFINFSTGTIVVGTIVIAAIAIFAFGSGGSSTTTNH